MAYRNAGAVSGGQSIKASFSYGANKRALGREYAAIGRAHSFAVFQKYRVLANMIRNAIAFAPLAGIEMAHFQKT